MTTQGDSGGPLLRKGSATQVGVISVGFGCNQRIPAIFTEVAAYRAWITDRVDEMQVRLEAGDAIWSSTAAWTAEGDDEGDEAGASEGEGDGGIMLAATLCIAAAVVCAAALMACFAKQMRKRLKSARYATLDENEDAHAKANVNQGEFEAGAETSEIEMKQTNLIGTDLVR